MEPAKKANQNGVISKRLLRPKDIVRFAGKKIGNLFDPKTFIRGAAMNAKTAV